MEREEQIKKQADIYTDDASNYTEYSVDGGWTDTTDVDLVEKAFIEGAKWADEHPKSPWISIKDDLPCNHKELIENENYTKKVLVVLAWNDDPSKKHIEICNMCNKIGSFNTIWYWRNIVYYRVVYWKPLPELPKE